MSAPCPNLVTTRERRRSLYQVRHDALCAKSRPRRVLFNVWSSVRGLRPCGTHAMLSVLRTARSSRRDVCSCGWSGSEFRVCARVCVCALLPSAITMHAVWCAWHGDTGLGSCVCGLPPTHAAPSLAMGMQGAGGRRD